MYKRYIPADASYTQVKANPTPEEWRPRREPEQGPGPERRPSTAQPQHPGGNRTPQNGPAGFRPPPFLGGKDGLSALFSGKERGGLSGLLKALHLEDIDAGDVLLLLIVLYLLVEGDDLELVIALGLTLIMGLGDDK